MTPKLHPDLAFVHEPKLHELYRYWESKCGGRDMPTRADIDPQELRPHLPNLVLVDVVGSPPQFRFRLAGTDIVARYGAELTGKSLDDIDLGGDLAAIREQYERTARERVTTYCRHFIETRQRKFLSYERLLMPLSADGSTVNMLLGGIYALPPELAEAAASTHRSSQGRDQVVTVPKARSA